MFHPSPPQNPPSTPTDEPQAIHLQSCSAKYLNLPVAKIPVVEFWRDIRLFESDFNSRKPLTSTQRHKISQMLTSLEQIFSQFSEFNQIQSKTIFPIFANQKNLLICAPTASGKTTLFDFTILKTILTSKILGETKTFDKKIIYCGPIKS